MGKGRWAKRHALLFERFAEHPSDLLERAAGSEDAFDAAVSALVMGAHGPELEALTRSSDPRYAVEGRIWRPGSPERRIIPRATAPRKDL